MNKKIKFFTAILSAFMLIMTGTLAWEQTITQVNEFLGRRRGGEDITLHDDFDPGINKKDVYVENTGDTRLLVRVKLDEAINLVNNRWRPGASDRFVHYHNGTAADWAHANAGGVKFHDYFTWTMGGWKHYMPANGLSKVVNDKNDYNGTEPGVRTTPNATIVTAAAFLAMTDEQQKNFDGWIFSTDGYAYWSHFLEAGEATGLLLNGVKTEDILKNTEYYYAINITVEAVDEDDVAMWLQGAAPKEPGGAKHPEATTDGKEVIIIILGNYGQGGGNGGNGNGGELPVNKPQGGFTPITNPDPLKGDGYYIDIDFGMGTQSFYHSGAIHLEDIITDGDYSNVTVEALEAKYGPYVTIDDCERHDHKPSIIFSYVPTADEWLQYNVINGDPNTTIPIEVRLTRGDEEAVITINMIYPLSLIVFPPKP